MAEKSAASKRAAYARHDALQQEERDRARSARRDKLVRTGVRTALDHGLRLAPHNTGEPQVLSRRTRRFEERIQKLVEVEVRRWNVHHEGRRREALRFIEELQRGIYRGTSEGRRARLADAVDAWCAQPAPPPIDEAQAWKPPIGTEAWSASDYSCLYHDLGHDGSEAYYQTTHWRQRSQSQRRELASCERCGVAPADFDKGMLLFHAHHLHYETVGAERIGVDLMTLCQVCHDCHHGRQKYPPYVTPDDSIPF